MGRAAGPFGDSSRRIQGESGWGKPGALWGSGRRLGKISIWRRHCGTSSERRTARSGALAQEADHGLAALLKNLGSVHCGTVRNKRRKCAKKKRGRAAGSRRKKTRRGGDD